MKKVILLVITGICLVTHAQENLNLVFYNVLNYPQGPPSNRNQILSLLIDEMQPDLFMVCELESQNGSNDILNTSLNFNTTRFAAAPYVNNTSSGSNLQQQLFFDSNKFELDETSIVQTSLRDINRYRLKTRTEEELFLEVFVAHLKASQGEDNEAIRLDMVEDLINFLDTLDPGVPVVFAGDFNLYSSSEPAYQAILNSQNAIRFIDPINTPGDWNSNSSFAAVHTQSTRISNDDFDDFGAGGGLDSRFDFILLSENMQDQNSPITYVENSYAAFGNNENCYNNRIDDEDCEGVYSSATRALLYQMSDHLPVVAQLAIDATFLPPLSLEDIELWWLGNTIVEETLEIHLKYAQPNGHITIYDQTGRIVLQIQVTANNISLPISFLSQGLYYARLSDTQAKAHKFIKVN